MQYSLQEVRTLTTLPLMLINRCDEPGTKKNKELTFRNGRLYVDAYFIYRYNCPGNKSCKKEIHLVKKKIK